MNGAASHFKSGGGATGNSKPGLDFPQIFLQFWLEPWEDDMTIAVGFVYDAWKSDADQLALTLAKNLRVEPVRAQSFGLAGPNDVLQWVASYAEWKAIAFGLTFWLADKMAGDLYELLKEKVLKAFGSDTETDSKIKDVGNLAADLSKIVQDVQHNGGDVLLTTRETPVSDGETLDRSTATVYLPPLSSNASVATARLIIQFATSIAAIDQNGGGIPSEILRAVVKSNGEELMALRDRLTEEKDSEDARDS
jgi:hypothetical protein